MKKTDKVYLIYVNNQQYLMVNPFDKLTVGMCNSQVTKNWGVTDAELNKCVFEFFGVDLHIFPIPFDRRTARFKYFEKTVRYFNIEYLPALASLNKTI